MAAPASDVRVHDDQLALGEAAPVWRLGDPGREFVTNHARVLEERLAPFKDMVVGATDADAFDFQSRFALAPHDGPAQFLRQFVRLAADDGFVRSWHFRSLEPPASSAAKPLFLQIV
jgi:hypothetical protein